MIKRILLALFCACSNISCVNVVKSIPIVLNEAESQEQMLLSTILNHLATEGVIQANSFTKIWDKIYSIKNCLPNCLDGIQELDSMSIKLVKQKIESDTFEMDDTFDMPYQLNYEYTNETERRTRLLKDKHDYLIIKFAKPIELNHELWLINYICTNKYNYGPSLMSIVRNENHKFTVINTYHCGDF